MEIRKRWHFLLPLPIAMIVTEVIILCRAILMQDSKFFAEFWKGLATLLWITSAAGAAFFPSGLVAPFVVGRPGSVAVVWISAGWTLYGIAIVWGLIKPHRHVFLALCVLLLINIGGCQFVATEGLRQLH